jgi:hypothetical protein
MFRSKYPDVLFRFLPFNKEYLREIIIDNTLYFPSPIDFNDPFDCNLPRELIVDKDYIYQLTLNRFQSENPGFPKSNVEKIVNRSFDKKLWPNYQKLWLQEHRKRLQDGGVLCFCKAYDNFLLWSHYAAKHTGVCIEFDMQVVMQELKNRVLLNKVNYFKKVPTCKIMVVNHAKDINDASFKKLLFSKHNRWKYEEEYRIFFPEIVTEYKCRKFQFKNSIIKRLFLGWNINDANMREIFDLYTRKHSRDNLKSVKCNIQEFNLEITDFDCKWY